jgi:C1A family cysteine protease
MAYYLTQHGPMYVSVAASSQVWRHYESGILDSEECGTKTNHGLLAVGYDVSEGYWLLKNSWGTSWGDKGYIKIKFDVNMCGINKNAFWAIFLMPF